jgi:cytochrome c-type biogenesis protein
MASVAILAMAGCDKPEAFRPLTVGDPAPDYVAATLAGDRISLADLRGKVVLLNVWATWCIPCREEMPALQRLYQELGSQGLEVVAVSVDHAGAAEDVARFVDERDLDFTIGLDAALAVQDTFRTMGVPESFLIDREGRIAHRWIGQFDPEAAEVRDLLRKALEG